MSRGNALDNDEQHLERKGRVMKIALTSIHVDDPVAAHAFYTETKRWIGAKCNAQAPKNPACGSRVLGAGV